MRNLKILYVILLESLKQGDKEDFYNSGICGEIDNLNYFGIITSDESIELSRHFKENKPTYKNEYKYFYHHNLFKPKSAWWWGGMWGGQKYRDIRIKFIEAIIQNLK